MITDDELYSQFLAIMSDMEFLEMEVEADEDKVSEIEDRLREWGCRAFRGHRWVLDQCCYWQHQYCVHCHAAKYPDLADKTCNVLTHEMGKMTEDEFLTRKGGNGHPWR